MSPRAYAAALALSRDPRAPAPEREVARQRCLEYEQTHGTPTELPNLAPWWLLKIARRGSRVWMANTLEFREALRALCDGQRQSEYVFDFQTIKDVQDRRVDWRYFPISEPWRVASQCVTGERPFGSTDRPVVWTERDCDRAGPKIGRMRRARPFVHPGFRVHRP